MAWVAGGGVSSRHEQDNLTIRVHQVDWRALWHLETARVVNETTMSNLWTVIRDGSTGCSQLRLAWPYRGSGIEEESDCLP